MRYDVSARRVVCEFDSRTTRKAADDGMLARPNVSFEPSSIKPILHTGSLHMMRVPITSVGDGWGTGTQSGSCRDTSDGTPRHPTRAQQRRAP